MAMLESDGAGYAARSARRLVVPGDTFERLQAPQGSGMS